MPKNRRVSPRRPTFPPLPPVLAALKQEQEQTRREAKIIFDRLCNEPRTQDVRLRLLKRGMSEAQFEFLLQTICRLPSHWKAALARQKNSLIALKQFERLGKAMRHLSRRAIALPSAPFYWIALEVAHDAPKLAAAGQTGVTEGFYRHPYHFLERAAVQIENRVAAERRALDVPARTSGKRKRSITQSKFTLLEIFKAIEMLSPKMSDSELPPRSPNLETEILASVVLNRRIRRGEVSRLRPSERKKYDIWNNALSK